MLAIGFLISKFLKFFIFGCVGSSLLCVGFIQLWRAGATLCCGAQASHCGGFSSCGARTLGARDSVVAACGLSSCGTWALELRLSSCGARAQLLHGMWAFPRPGIKLVPCVGRWILNHCATREVPAIGFFEGPLYLAEGIQFLFLICLVFFLIICVLNVVRCSFCCLSS